nr:hypothetical protein [Kibdelosporangium sp. MJ126-NF4]
MTAQELRTTAAADKGTTPLVLVPAVVGNAQTAKTMDSKTVPAAQPTLSAGQDQAGNAAVAGAAMRMIPMALPKKESRPGR